MYIIEFVLVFLNKSKQQCETMQFYQLEEKF